MKFFMPGEGSSPEWERSYQELREDVQAIKDGPRIYALMWKHQGELLSFRVGEPLPAKYKRDTAPVEAIIDNGTFYVMCTANDDQHLSRVVAGRDHDALPFFFDD